MEQCLYSSNSQSSLTELEIPQPETTKGEGFGASHNTKQLIPQENTSVDHLHIRPRQPCPWHNKLTGLGDDHPTPWSSKWNICQWNLPWLHPSWVWRRRPDNRVPGTTFPTKLFKNFPLWPKLVSHFKFSLAFTIFILGSLDGCQLDWCQWCMAKTQSCPSETSVRHPCYPTSNIWWTSR